MGFKIGKFLGRITSGLVKSVPQITSGFQHGGVGGGALAALGSASYGGALRATPTGSAGMFSAPSASFPNAMTTPQFGGEATTVGNVQLQAFNKSIFDLAMRIIDKLGIIVKNPNSVKALIRRILAKMIRFARATPGMSIISMLTSLGLTLVEAEHLINWYTAAGKKRRRLRVTNVKALKRSIRRLEGFHRLSTRVNAALAGRAPRTGVSRSHRRCMRCKKSPCCC